MAWNLDLDGATAKAHNAHLSKVETWLRNGADQPANIVRAVQVLACSDAPETAKRPCVLQVCALEGGTAEEIGRGTARVNAAQSLVLAAWSPTFTGSWFRIAPMLTSPWEILAARDNFNEAISRWRHGVLQNELQQTEPLTSPPPPQVSLRLTRPPTAEFNPNHWQHLANNTSAAWQFNSFGPQLVNTLEELRTFVNRSTGIADTLENEITRALNTHHQALTSWMKSVLDSGALLDSRRNELLWWGQARYCHTLARPFRRLANADERLFYAVRDVAHPSRSKGLPLEPVAAYLVEVLHTLDPDAINERRSLLDWCRSLTSFWAPAPASPKGGPESPPLPPPVSTKLAALVDEDPTALPVTWTRRQLEQRLPIDDLGAAVGLPADVTLDRAQWAAWLLREFLLDREFQAAP